MGVIQGATMTLGEAARRLDLSVDALLALVYGGVLPAAPDQTSGRLFVQVSDVERLARR